MCSLCCEPFERVTCPCGGPLKPISYLYNTHGHYCNTPVCVFCAVFVRFHPLHDPSRLSPPPPRLTLPYIFSLVSLVLRFLSFLSIFFSRLFPSSFSVFSIRNNEFADISAKTRCFTSETFLFLQININSLVDAKKCRINAFPH